jgi:hypothetical protein
MRKQPAPRNEEERTRRNTTVNLDITLLSQLKASAALQYITLQEALDEAIREYLKAHPATIPVQE